MKTSEQLPEELHWWNGYMGGVVQGRLRHDTAKVKEFK